MRYILEIDSHKAPDEIEELRRFIGKKDFCFDDDTVYGNTDMTKCFSEEFGYSNGKKGLKFAAKLICVDRTESIDHWFVILWNKYRTKLVFEINTSKPSGRYSPPSYYQDEYAAYQGRSADGSGFTGNPII